MSAPRSLRREAAALALIFALALVAAFAVARGCEGERRDAIERAASRPR